MTFYTIATCDNVTLFLSLSHKILSLKRNKEIKIEISYHAKQVQVRIVSPLKKYSISGCTYTLTISQAFLSHDFTPLNPKVFKGAEKRELGLMFLNNAVELKSK